MIFWALNVLLTFPQNGDWIDSHNAPRRRRRGLSAIKWKQTSKSSTLRGYGMVAMFHKHGKHVSWHFNSMFCWFHVLWFILRPIRLWKLVRAGSIYSTVDGSRKGDFWLVGEREKIIKYDCRLVSEEGSLQCQVAFFFLSGLILAHRRNRQP